MSALPYSLRVPPAGDPRVHARRLAVADAVRVRRQRLGLSQEQLAAKAGCDRQTINRMENSQHSSLLDRWFEVADALEVRITELLAAADE